MIRRPAISWAAAVFLIAGQLSTFLWMLLRGSRGRGPTDALTFFAFAVLLSSSLTMFITARRAVFRMSLATYLLIAVVLLLVVSEPCSFEWLLVCPLVMVICLSEAFPRGLIVSCAVIVVAFCALVLRQPFATGDARPDLVAAIAGHAGFLAYSLLLAVTASTLLLHRERLIDRNNELRTAREAVRKLAEVNLNYQQYAHTAEQKAMVEERQRITREIHDVIGYTFTNNITMMEALSDMVRTEADTVKRLLSLCRENTEEGFDKIRHALHLLRAQEGPPETDIKALARMVRIFEIATGAKVRLELGNMPWSLPGSLSAISYHIVQEALTNAVRHGHATRIDIVVWLTANEMNVSICDNGAGADDYQEGIGISSMRERVAQVGGTLSIYSSPGSFKVSAVLPL